MVREKKSFNLFDHDLALKAMVTWGTILGNLHVCFLFIVRVPQREFKLLKL